MYYMYRWIICSRTACAYGELIDSTSWRDGGGSVDMILSNWFIVDVPGYKGFPNIQLLL